MVIHLAFYWILSRSVHFLRNLMFYHHNACEQSEQTPWSAYLLFKEVLINWIHQLPEGTFSAKTVKVIFQRYYFWVSISSFCLLRQLEPFTKGMETIFTIMIKIHCEICIHKLSSFIFLRQWFLSVCLEIGRQASARMNFWKCAPERMANKISLIGGCEEQPKNTIKSWRVTQVYSMESSSSHNY